MALKKPYEMDRVWRDFEPTDESLSHLDGPSCECALGRKSPRPTQKEFARVQHYRMALSWIPIQKAKFKDVLTRMHVPSVFMDMVKRPRTVFKKLKSSVQGQPCEVYILSVDSILTQYTAMSVTYFPKTQQVFGLFLGYGSPDDVTNMASKLFNNRAFVNNPFVLVSAFLELERKHRLRQVDNMVDGLRIKISKGQHIQKSNKETSDDQPETFL
ncbi:hypothetical protein CEP52_002439 [Fusarium oligoseptatum]|uniref:Uncharacterized protein n=1 Tax=Fusarium oligoseptatum TaxID=2604345 RepID=A0A428UDR2_9HYPO|nr:hypothetical protein CEP52_002439 [Fusarium oligoseptatum]